MKRKRRDPNKSNWAGKTVKSRINVTSVENLPDEVLIKEYEQLALIPKKHVDNVEKWGANIDIDKEKYYRRIERITGKGRLKTQIPKVYECIGEGRNWRYFLDKGKWVEERTGMVATELDKRGLGNLIVRKKRFNVKVFEKLGKYNTWTPS